MRTVSRLRMIFWGVFFAFLDFTLNGVNVLPDVIGYLLLIIGCGGLAGESRNFAVVPWLAAAMGVLTIWPDWLVEEFAQGMGTTVMVLGGLLMWVLLGGIMDFTKARQGEDLARRASRLRRAYVGLTIVIWIAGLLLDGSAHGFLVAVVVVTVVCVIGVMVLILKLIGRVRRESAANPGDDQRTNESMVTGGLVAIVIAALLGAGWVHENSGYRSQTTSGANFHARSPEEMTRVEADLMRLLQEKGFTANYQPDEMDQFAGLHVAGENRDSWLESTREEFKGIYLHLQMMKSDIQISTKWEHQGFTWDANRRHRKALELLLELARWFGQGAEKDDIAEPGRNTGVEWLEKELEKVSREQEKK